MRKYKAFFHVTVNWLAAQKFTLAIFKSPFHLMLHVRAAFADFFRPPKTC
jgi:hypothetical protein